MVHGIMNVHFAILAALALLVFAGCASTPNEEKPMSVQDLPVGTFGK
jgi:predicted component of type VI protein secretion system